MSPCSCWFPLATPVSSPQYKDTKARPIGDSDLPVDMSECANESPDRSPVQVVFLLLAQCMLGWAPALPPRSRPEISGLENGWMEIARRYECVNE